MHTYSITTLIDITENGVLRNQFPFKTKSGELVHDAATLAIASFPTGAWDFANGGDLDVALTAAIGYAVTTAATATFTN